MKIFFLAALLTLSVTALGTSAQADGTDRHNVTTGKCSEAVCTGPIDGLTGSILWGHGTDPTDR